MLFVLAGVAAAAQSVTSRPIAITGVTVIDPQAGAAVPGMTVVIRGGRIASAGASAAVPRGAVVIDGRGKFLMPGLWDMHVHLGFARESAFPALVANGVTAVRDLGGDLSEIDRWRKEIAAGSRVGPLIVRAGPMLVGQDPLRFQVLIQTPEEGRDTVRRLHAQCATHSRGNTRRQAPRPTGVGSVAGASAGVGGKELISRCTKPQTDADRRDQMQMAGRQGFAQAVLASVNGMRQFAADCAPKMSTVRGGRGSV